jgi:excisionase family DNA binding protein
LREQLCPIAVSPADAAKLIGVSRATLYNLLDRGTIPSAEIGGSRRIRVADLERLFPAEPDVP